MKKRIGRALIAALLIGVSISGNVNAANSKVTEVFSDVKEGSWYEDAVQYVYDQRIMVGSKGEFKPEQNITRAQLVTTLYNLAGEPSVTDKEALTVFTDVAADKYYADAICWAYDKGVASGNAGKFQPENLLTRQQMSMFFFKFADAMGYDISVRGDYSYMLNAENVSDYAKETMSWAVGIGLLSGSEVTDDSGIKLYDLKPVNTTTRAQVAAVLQNFRENVKHPEGTEWFYTKNREGTITINAYSGDASGKLEIPQQIDGMTVTGIGDNVFAECEDLEDVVMPDTVEKIGKYAFDCCVNLKSVTFPENLKQIYTGAFFGCRKLKSIELPKALESIGESAFSHCSNLVTLEIPESVECIGAYALSADRLHRVLFLGDAPQIDENAFGGMTCDAYYFLEKSGWDRVISKKFPKEITWTALNDYSEENQAEWLYAEKNDGTICLVQYLGEEISADFTVPAVVDGKQVTAIGAALFANMESLIKVTIPEQITTIEMGTFSGCTNLEAVSIPKTVTQIRKYSFYKCSSLKELTLPENLKIIGEYAFQNCNALKVVVIPKSVQEIGLGTFGYCENLESIVVPNSVTKFGNYAFSRCKNLKNVTLEEGLTVLANGMFDQCESLEEITIPDSVKEIPYDCFNECGSLKNFEIPKTIERIGAHAFRRCYSLKEITIPKSVKKIEDGAFMQSINIKKVVFEGAAPTVNSALDEAIFYGIETEVYYPDNDPTWKTAAFAMIQAGNKKLTWIPYEAIK